MAGDEVAADIEDDVDAANNSDLSAADFCRTVHSQKKMTRRVRGDRRACTRLYSTLYCSRSFLNRSTLAMAFSLICGTISLLAM